MKTTTKFFLTAAVGLVTALSVHAQTLFVDFGEATLTTGGNYNNLVTTNATLTAGPPIANAIDSLGNFTGISLSESGFDTGNNQAGTLAPSGAASIFDPQATRDNLFGHGVVFNGQGPLELAVLSFTGLNPTFTYDLTFFASRLGVTDNRETQYQVVGLNSGTAFLDAANNVSNVATVSGISPTALGNLTVNISVGPNNNNSSGFFYLGALEMVGNPVPEPSSLALAALGGLAATIWGRQLGGKRS